MTAATPEENIEVTFITNPICQCLWTHHAIITEIVRKGVTLVIYLQHDDRFQYVTGQNGTWNWFPY